MTQEDDELMLANASSVMLPEDDADDMPALTLPTFKDVNQDSVFKSVRAVFPGFTFDNTDTYQNKFEDSDAIATYMDKALQDINKSQVTGDIAQRTHNSASEGYFWAMCATFDRTLSSSDYGKGVYNTIAARLKKSVPYVYQLRAVAKRLTVEQCFLLGSRNCSQSTLRRLAQIKDDARRTLIINTFIEETHDTSNQQAMEKARKSFFAAISDALKNADYEMDATSAPEKVDEGPKVTVEFDALMSAFSNLKKVIKILGDETTMTNIADSMSKFYLMDNVPNAEKHFDAAKADATLLRTTFEEIRDDYLPQLIQDLTSVEHSSLMHAEDK